MYSVVNLLPVNLALVFLNMVWRGHGNLTWFTSYSYDLAASTSICSEPTAIRGKPRVVAVALPTGTLYFLLATPQTFTVLFLAIKMPLLVDIYGK